MRVCVLRFTLSFLGSRGIIIGSALGWYVRLHNGRQAKLISEPASTWLGLAPLWRQFPVKAEPPFAFYFSSFVASYDLLALINLMDIFGKNRSIHRIIVVSKIGRAGYSTLRAFRKMLKPIFTKARLIKRNLSLAALRLEAYAHVLKPEQARSATATVAAATATASMVVVAPETR